VLRKASAWGPSPYQWAAAGYSGAIGSGRTICGFLFGGALYLGYLHGENSAHAPDLKNPGRLAAITAVKNLFAGFIERFGDTDCRALSGCDFSQPADRQRYYRDRVYETSCFLQMRYVIDTCKPVDAG
jgi:hypothetical protein